MLAYLAVVRKPHQRQNETFGKFFELELEQKFEIQAALHNYHREWGGNEQSRETK